MLVKNECDNATAADTRVTGFISSDCFNKSNTQSGRSSQFNSLSVILLLQPPSSDGGSGLDG